MTRYATTDAPARAVDTLVHFGAMADGAIPNMSNGDGTSDPNEVIDLHGQIPSYFQAATVTNGRLTSPQDDDGLFVGTLLRSGRVGACRVSLNLAPLSADAYTPIDADTYAAAGFITPNVATGVHAVARLIDVNGYLGIRYSIATSAGPVFTERVSVDYTADDLFRAVGTISLLHDGDGTYHLSRGSETIASFTYRDNLPAAGWSWCSLFLRTLDDSTHPGMFAARWFAVTDPATSLPSLGAAVTYQDPAGDAGADPFPLEGISPVTQLAGGSHDITLDYRAGVASEYSGQVSLIPNGTTDLDYLADGDDFLFAVKVSYNLPDQQYARGFPVVVPANAAAAALGPVYGEWVLDSYWFLKVFAGVPMTLTKDVEYKWNYLYVPLTLEEV